MTGSAGHGTRTPGRLAALLTEAATEAIRTVGGRVSGVYLRAGTPGLLRLAVLAGLPAPLFHPWWRLHADRPFPVADAYRLGVQVALPNATEAMRRYPQFAAGLPFQFGSLYVPVVGGSTSFGVLAMLRTAAADTSELLADQDRLAHLAADLGVALRRLEADGPPLTWDDRPLSVRPPTTRPGSGRTAHFSWDPATDLVTPDGDVHALLGLPPGEFPTTLRDLARTLAPSDFPQLLALLREAAEGRPPPLPLPVRAADGALRLLELRPPGPGRGSEAGSGVGPAPGSATGPALHPATDAAARSPSDARTDPPSALTPAKGVLRDPSADSPADAAAGLLPEGVFCLDRLGLVMYANPRAAHLLGRSRARLLGRAVWEGVPWLRQPAFEDHLRGALLSPDPVHFHVRRPATDEDQSYEGDWLALSVYPGPDILTCTVVPSSRMDDLADPHLAAPGGPSADGVPRIGSPTSGAPTAPQYRPIVLAIALTEAVTARQVSAVVTQELLPAFGGRRLAIYLLQDRHLYLAWENGFPEGFLAPFEGVGLDARLPGVETLTSGRPLFFDSMEQMQAAYPGMAMDATQGARAFLPLIASGRPVGSCILGFEHPRSFSTEERTVLTALAGLIAHAMEKAQRYDSEAALARGLQQALLPRRLSSHPQVETAGRYLPGTQGMDVGGDWYDVVEAGDGLALVIGDVQGHGVQAAATMGQLRSAVRAFALGDRPPDEVMSGTNRLLIDLDPGQFASCCYLRLDPANGRLRVARAGHPPPLVRGSDGRTHVMDIPGGVVLGVTPDAHYPVMELLLEPGAILALYTDGLVERPGFDIDDGIGALRVALERAGPSVTGQGEPSLAGLADRLTATARHAADRPDDIALLLATRHAMPRPPD
ncbi:SpoIIE family protein phosphatase [Streptomyces sp. NPDC001315]|uniref:SpoIIE family protein phosphatase n=1 Tax=Streptomyces sp. NPDC001315 TaxID=3364562 RepID=UPI00367D72B9